MDTATNFAPLRSIADVEALERVPLGERIPSWDANDWIRQGLDRAPDKVAIQYVADGRPDTPPLAWTYRELKERTIATANLFRSLGVSCCVNWMLEPEHWAGLIKASHAKAIVVPGPTPGYEIFEKFSTIRDQVPAGVRVLTVQMPGDRQSPESDVE